MFFPVNCFPNTVLLNTQLKGRSGLCFASNDRAREAGGGWRAGMREEEKT